MHNHNLEIHIEEDINMPNGDNPYLTTEEGQEFDINALIQYITDVESQYGDIWQGAGQGWNVEYDPQQAQQEMGFNVNLPTYGYQGMSPEIMQALGNVFTPGEGGFSPEMFGEDFIMSQIQEQLGDLTEDDLAGMITSMPEGELGTGWGGSYDPTIVPGSIGDWDYGDMQSALGFTNIFDPESLAATLTQLGGIDPDTGEPIRPGEVKALTPEMIEKTTSAYYDPYESAGRESLIEKLGKARGGVSTGGFAGSGARQAGLSGAERLYQGGYGDLLGDIMKMRGGATEDVLGTIYGWQELLSDQ